MALKPEVKKAWVEALRSDEYKQARETLCNAKGEMCCLGVVYDAAVDGNWTKLVDDEDLPNLSRTEGAWGISYRTATWMGQPVLDTNDGALPPPVLKKIGLTDDEMYRLIELNDNEKASFKKIANYIEKNL